jgi:hypothetical protein
MEKKLKIIQRDEGKTTSSREQSPSQEDGSDKPHDLEIYPSNFPTQAQDRIA